MQLGLLECCGMFEKLSFLERDPRLRGDERMEFNGLDTQPRSFPRRREACDGDEYCAASDS